MTSVSKDEKKVEPLCTVSGNVNGTVIMENYLEVLKTLKIESLYDLEISLLSIYMKKFKAGS